jgi:AraC family transcriptional regulator of adaptative response / DNA-3-methyladenine glycosylase II
VAAQRIAAGALNGRGVAQLARELGVSDRHLRRVLERELGVSPLELAQTHRLLLAKRLLADTSLSVTRIAFASGFQSLRRFNGVFRERYRLSPSALRRSPARATVPTSPRPAPRGDLVRLTLAYRPPLAWELLLWLLGRGALPGVESITGGVYGRTVQVDGRRGIVLAERPTADKTHIVVQLSAALLPVLMPLLARLRRLFDLDAEPETIAAHLTSAGLPVVGENRGLRVPGAADPFELAVRAILGQQVTVKGASTLMSRLTEAFGARIETEVPELTHLAATPEQVAGVTPARIASLGMPLARATTIHMLAEAVARGDIQLGPEADVRLLTKQLLDIPGIGPWTAEYVIMRAVHWPDAFPESDLVLRRAAGDLSPAKLRQAAEGWRPWRAYAAMHLWRRR